MAAAGGGSPARAAAAGARTSVLPAYIIISLSPAHAMHAWPPPPPLPSPSPSAARGAQVRPSQHGTFRDEWAKLYDKVKDEEGLVAFKLRKTVNDDIVFIGYGEV